MRPRIVVMGQSQVFSKHLKTPKKLDIIIEEVDNEDIFTAIRKTEGSSGDIKQSSSEEAVEDKDQIMQVQLPQASELNLEDLNFELEDQQTNRINECRDNRDS